MACGIMRDLDKVLVRVNKEIKGNSVGFFGGGLASEGYAGGYRDAIHHVINALNGVKPNCTLGYWDEYKERTDG